GRQAALVDRRRHTVAPVRRWPARALPHGKHLARRDYEAVQAAGHQGVVPPLRFGLLLLALVDDNRPAVGADLVREVGLLAVRMREPGPRQPVSRRPPRQHQAQPHLAWQRPPRQAPQPAHHVRAVRRLRESRPGGGGHGSPGSAGVLAGGRRWWVACSYAYASLSIRGSLCGRPKNVMPVGSPSDVNGAGTVTEAA